MHLWLRTLALGFYISVQSLPAAATTNNPAAGCMLGLEQAAPRATRILSTLGDMRKFDVPLIRSIVESGADSLRLNASHLAAPQILLMVDRIRSLSELHPGVLLDLQGPKVRVGNFDTPITIKTGDRLFLHPQNQGADGCPEGAVPVPVPDALLSDLLPQNPLQGLQIGQRVLFADGKFESRILELDRIRKTVTVQLTYAAFGAHHLEKKKGLNFPDTDMPFPALSEKDRIDAEAGLFSGGVHYYALSFVRGRQDVRELRNHLQFCESRFQALIQRGYAEIATDVDLGSTIERLYQLLPNPSDVSIEAKLLKVRERLLQRAPIHPRIIAKIELPEAMRNLADITDEADGLMIARGDLAVEAGIHSLFDFQLQISRTAKSLNKPFIVATHVVDGLVNTGRVSRSNATDVGFAVLSRADVIMTSEETAARDNGAPSETVEELVKLIRSSEAATADVNLQMKLTSSTPAFRNDSLEAYLTVVQGRALSCASDDASLVWDIRNLGVHRDLRFFSDNPSAIRQTSLLRGVEAIVGTMQEAADRTACVEGFTRGGASYLCCAH